MKYDTMNEYTLQSYFKSLCNSFMIAYSQVKRLEEQEEELEETSPAEELDLVESLLALSELSIPDALKEKYVEQKYLQEELIRRKDELQKKHQAYCNERKEIEDQTSFWEDNRWNIEQRMRALLHTCQKKGFSIIVTSEAEVITFMGLLKNESLHSIGNIINTNEEYLQYFPQGEMCQAFFRAYELKNEEDMKGVIEKYF